MAEKRNSDKPHSRKIGIVLCDALILAICAFGALLTKYAPEIEREVLSDILIWLPALIVIYVGCFAIFGMYRVLWKYADSYQLLKQGMANVVSFGVTFILNFVFSFFKGYRALSNNYLITFCMFSIVGIFASRLAIQNFGRHNLATELNAAGELRRVMVVGAGDAGAHLVEMLSKARGSMGTVAVIVDDDPLKQGYLIGDVPVSGTTEDIARLVRSEDISDIIIALPTASKQRLDSITQLCLETGCYVRVFDKLKHVDIEQ